MYLSAAVFGLLIYLAVMKFSLRISGLELTEYAGTNTYGITSLYGYYLRIREAYRDFIIPDTSKEYCMFPFHWNGWHVILIGMLLIFLLICIVRFLVGKEYRKVVFLGIISCLMPAAFQFNMILYGSESMHSLHVYHYSLMFICLAVLSENCGKSICIVKKHLMQQPQKILQKVIIVSAYTMIFVFGALYIRYDNSCYMSNEIRHRAAVSYFTTLITRIQSIDGYDPSIPIAYINSMEKSTEADTLYPQHDLIVTNPYCYPIVNSWNWEKFVVYWCGYSPNVIRYSADEIQQNMEIQKMPQYPSAGSIRMIDGVIVVKF